MTSITLQQLEIKELENLIRRVIKEELAALLENNREQQVGEIEEPLISKVEAAKILSVSLPTLAQMIKATVVKTYRVGKRIKFKRSELISSLQQTKYIKRHI